jgi:preprotein translocase subunit SecG
MEHLVIGGAGQDLLLVSLRVMFFLTAVLLIGLVLLQEGKGGGLAAALGGQGAETFGVATGGVNRVTMVLAGIFLACAVAHAVVYKPATLLETPRKVDTPPKEGGEVVEPPKKEEPPK